jgi:methyl-accepting chemotaxis protein
MNNIKIGVRLAAGFALVTVLFVLTLLLVGIAFKHVTGDIGLIKEETLPYVLVVDEMDLRRSEVQQFLTDVSATHDKGGFKEAEEAARRFLNGVNQFKQKFRQENDVARQKQIESIEANFNAFNAKGKLMAEAYISQGIDAGNLLMKGSDKLAGFDHDSEVIAAELAKFREYQISSANEFTASTLANATFTRNMMIVAGLVATLLAIIFSVAITRSVILPISNMRSTIVAIGKEGDFTRRITVNSHDEIGEAASSFNELMVNLQTAIGQINQGTEKMVTASHSLSTYSHQVAHGSAGQTEATSMMAASVAQTTFGISMVSAGASEATRLSKESGEHSEKGGEIIHRAVGEMMKISEAVRQTSLTIENLGEQSTRISTIVNVIKEIADQTNLLALNAAIEAARAGEQGRGFAVVADEVRKLAERTAKATQEVSGMINTIQSSSSSAVAGMAAMVGQVDVGASLAREAGEAITQIKQEANQLSSTIGDISNSLDEQSKASDEIASQIEKVSNMTETNNSAAKQASEAASELEQLADEMRLAVHRFRI